MVRKGLGNAGTAVFVALPPVVAIGIVLAFVVAEVTGSTPFSYQPPANLAEAAGMGNAPEVRRYLELGQDPAQVMPVRPDIISSQITRVTPLEAAIWSRRGQLVRIFERAGALRDENTRQHVACLTAYLRVDEILEQIAPQGVAGCDPEKTFELIRARSQPAP
jgi:hypothetical protein